MGLRVNLVIDGNYLLYKSVFVLKKTRTIEEDLGNLIRRDYDRISKAFSYTNLFFVSDSGKSWRKELKSDYKGTRKKDDTIDWSMVYREYDKLKAELKTKPNCNVIEIEGMEGDDIVNYIVKTSNKEGFSNMIVANDGDLHQLLDFNLELGYINLMWNYKFNDERVYAPENYFLFLEKVEHENSSDDIFNLSDDLDFVKFVDDLINRTKLKEVNKEKSLFTKIIMGDTGDNIQGVVKIKDGKLNEEEGKGIGETGAEKCYDLYKEVNPELIDFKSDKFVDKASEICMFYKKIKDIDVHNNIKDRIKLNIKLVHLDLGYLPPTLLENTKQKVKL